MRLCSIVCACLLCMVACDDRPKGLYDVEDEHISLDEQRIEEATAQLAMARDPDDAEASRLFDEAVQELTLMGSTVEPYMIEALVGEEDWAIRYGSIHVLDSIGTKNCVAALIGALADDHPLVAQKAMYSLRVFCDHREVPEQGGPSGDGLPPIPERAADDFRADADYQLWLAWHRVHGQALHDAWEQWWDDNVHLVRIE